MLLLLLRHSGRSILCRLLLLLLSKGSASRHLHSGSLLLRLLGPQLGRQ